MPGIGHNEGPPLDGEGFQDEPDIAGQLEENEFQNLVGMDLQTILKEGQKALFARLVSRCRLGTASHQEQAILRNLLKDNGMTLGLGPESVVQHGEGAGANNSDIPVFSDPEY